MASDLVINTFTNQSWLPKCATAELIRSDAIPPVELLTSVHLLCFRESSLLMIRHRTRGWDIPGGHVENGEEWEAALRRELLEEACATAADVSPFLHLRIRIAGPKPRDYKYPYPESYIACFIGTVAEMKDFSADFETLERRFCSPAEVRTLEWYQRHSEIFECALELISKERGLP